MKALQQLRRFILANSHSEEAHEIREYVVKNIEDLSRDFCVTTSRLEGALASVADDSSLACRLLETIRKAEAMQRDLRKVARAKAAQASAEALGSMARWEGDRVEVDLVSLLASSLSKRNDLLVFTTDEFTVGVYQAPLFDLARLKKRHLTAFVDAKGLHVRWGEKGGLDLRSHEDRDADRIVMVLPARVVSVAA